MFVLTLVPDGMGEICILLHVVRCARGQIVGAFKANLHSRALFCWTDTVASVSKRAFVYVLRGE